MQSTIAHTTHLYDDTMDRMTTRHDFLLWDEVVEGFEWSGGIDAVVVR